MPIPVNDIALQPFKQDNGFDNFLSTYAQSVQMKRQQDADARQKSAFDEDRRLQAIDRLGAALDGIPDGDAAGFERVKSFAVQSGLLDPAEAQKYTVAQLPQIRALSAQARQMAKERAAAAMDQEKFNLDRRSTEANIRQSDAAAAASRALAGVRASGGGVEPGASLSPETVDFMADQYIAGDPSVMVNLGRGAQGAKNIIAVREAIARKVRAAGGSATDVAMAIGEFQGFKAGNRTLGGRVANMGMAVNEANQMADLVVSASKAVPRGQIRVVNDALNAYQSQTGDPKIVAFGAALNSFINAYARAINPTGVPTLADKEHARDMLNTGFTQGQIDAVIGQMKTEMAAAQKAPGITKEELRATFRNEHSAAAPAAPKSGWSIKRVP